MRTPEIKEFYVMTPKEVNDLIRNELDVKNPDFAWSTRENGGGADNSYFFMDAKLLDILYDADTENNITNWLVGLEEQPTDSEVMIYLIKHKYLPNGNYLIDCGW